MTVIFVLCVLVALNMVLLAVWVAACTWAQHRGGGR